MFNSLYPFIFVLLAACNAQGQKEKPELIQFINQPDSTIINWGNEWNSEGDSLGLRVDSVNGIYAFDKNTMLISGSFFNSASTIQSVLLKTTDGGKTWKEVMNPLHSIHLERVIFIDKKNGFVMGDWATESTGEELVLSMTNDGGNSWQPLPVFKKPHYTAVPVVFAYHNDTLKLELCLEGGTPVDGMYSYVSVNHGKTWVLKSETIIEDFSLPEQQKNAVIEKYASKKNNSYPFPWKTISAFPSTFHWKNGIITYKKR